MRVWAALPGLHNAFPVWPSADVAGSYRLVLHGIYWQAGRRADAAPVPLAGRVSAEFTFEL